MPKNIVVDIPTSPNEETVQANSAQAHVDEPSSADTDKAVENVSRIDSPDTLRSPPTPKAAPVIATDQKGTAEKIINDNESVKTIHAPDNDPVKNVITDAEASALEEVLVKRTTAEDESTGGDGIAEGIRALAPNRQDSLASLGTDSEDGWGSSEGTLKSGILPEKLEEDSPPVQNVVKKDIVVEAVDIGVAPQQAQVVVLESVVEEDEETLSGDQADSKNGSADGSAKVRARVESADGGAAPAAPLNGKQVTVDLPIPTDAPTTAPADVLTDAAASSTSTSAEQSEVNTMTKTKTKMKPPTKRDAKPLALTLRIVVALPIVVVVLYCTYRFSHLPIPSRSST